MHKEVEELLANFEKRINHGFATLREFNPCCHNDIVDSHSSPGDTQPFTID
jgi:hypothetical protein